MPAIFLRDGHYDIVFDCHAKGCLAKLRFQSEDRILPPCLDEARRYGWRQGLASDGKRGSADPWYCPIHTHLAGKPHRWAFA